MRAVALDNFAFPVVKKTPEGYLKGEAIVTKTGVFKYRNQDGTYRYELRHPDEVFKAESLETLKGVPITIDHPNEFVNAENSSSLMVGLTGESINIDGDFIVSSISITDQKGVKEVTNGKQELSMAYSHDRIEESGEYLGAPYTHKQTNIQYNHLAIVDRGRAGRSARIITMDGIDYDIDDYNNNNEEVNTMSEKELNKIVERLSAIESTMKENQDADNAMALDDAKKKIDLLQGELDGLNSKLAEAVKSNDESDESVIQAKVKERVDVMVKAKNVVALDNADELTNREIMEAVIKSTAKDADLEGKTDAYIAGRFDAIVSMDSTHLETSMSKVTSDKTPIKPTKTLADVQAAFYSNGGDK